MGCEVVGVDSSPEMVAAAKSLGLNAQVADGQQLPFDNAFDAVFSSAALHWMKNPVSVIDGVWRALKPGGRFVGELGGYGNVAAIIAGLESALAARGLSVACPWFFPRPETYRSMLETYEFEVESIALFPRPTSLPGDVGGWLETFAQPYLAAITLSERKGFVAEVVERLRPVLCSSDGHWVADYVRLRFFATKPKSAV
jgi:SAM-dependent methyltransferase